MEADGAWTWKNHQKIDKIELLRHTKFGLNRGNTKEATVKTNTLDWAKNQSYVTHTNHGLTSPTNWTNKIEELEGRKTREYVTKELTNPQEVT